MICLFILLFSDIIKTQPGQYTFSLKAGQYEISCYGAQGGGSYNDKTYQKAGGKGAYVSGILTINGTEVSFTANVGGKGYTSMDKVNAGGSNGGGSSGQENFDKDDGSGGGGGATDIRIYGNSFNNRIMVAAGGSGACKFSEGAPGGDLNGYYAPKDNIFQPSKDVDQSKGNSNGVGGDGKNVPLTGGTPGSGGGGGWRGGVSSNDYSYDSSTGYKGVARSGSSYISGFNGCTITQNIVFIYPQMTIGYKSGDGKFVVHQIFECSQNCHSCLSGTKCTKCFAGYFLDADNKCVSSCKAGFVGISGKCELCATGCSECNGKTTTCTKCNSLYYLHENKCISSCPKGYFEEAGKCNACSANCDTCTQKSDNCLSCKNNNKIYENKCYSTCPQNTIQNGNKCDKCHEPCASCGSSVKECTSCQDGYFLFDSKCVSYCPDKTVAQGNKCISCREPCETCSESDDHCTTCIDGYVLHNGQCYEDCPTGTKRSGITCI